MEKENKNVSVSVRFDRKTWKRLQKEAHSRGLDLAAYLRSLIFTHPDRKK